jgi:hypothetical protein
MKVRTTATLLALVSVTALAATGAWYHTKQALQESRARLMVSTLQPIAALLNESQSIITQLRAEPFVEKDNEVLEAYLIKIRRDGVTKTASMKERLDTLAENNTTLTTLIMVYLPNAKTPAFTSEANKFRNYAVAWRDRWNSVMDLFMAGGNYPAAGPAFPKEFPAAVQAEIAAAK